MGCTSLKIVVIKNIFFLPLLEIDTHMNFARFIGDWFRKIIQYIDI